MELICNLLWWLSAILGFCFILLLLWIYGMGPGGWFDRDPPSPDPPLVPVLDAEKELDAKKELVL